jgi:hypothetical protein
MGGLGQAHTESVVVGHYRYGVNDKDERRR